MYDLLSFILSQKLLQMIPCQLVQVTTLKDGWMKMFGYLSQLGLSTSTCLEARLQRKRSLVFRLTLKVVPPFCILAGNTSDGEGSLGMNGTSVSNGTRSSPINISH